MSGHKFSIEYDGSLVIDGVVVLSPGPGFPKAAIKDLVHERAAMLKALKRVSTHRVLCGMSGKTYVRCLCCDAAVPVGEYPQSIIKTNHTKDCTLGNALKS